MAKNPNIRQKHIVTNSIKTLKMVHIKTHTHTHTHTTLAAWTARDWDITIGGCQRNLNNHNITITSWLCYNKYIWLQAGSLHSPAGFEEANCQSSFSESTLSEVPVGNRLIKVSTANTGYSSWEKRAESRLWESGTWATEDYSQAWNLIKELPPSTRLDFSAVLD